MAGFHTLDNLIKEKLKSKDITHHEFNPFYVTSEEVLALLNEEWLENDTELFPGLEILGSLFDLDDFEKKVLMVILAPEIETKYERIYAYVQDDLNRKFPTVSLISSLLSKNSEEKLQILPYFSSHSPLRTFRLIKFVDPGDGISFFHQPIKIEDSVRDFILGYYHLDSRFQAFCQLIPPVDQNEKPPEAESLVKRITEGIEKEKRFLLHLYGRSDFEKKNRALQIASKLGYGLLVVNMPQALESVDSIIDLMGLLYREAVLSGTLVYFDAFDALYEHKQYPLYEPLLFDGLDRFSRLTFFASEKQWKPKKLPKAHTFLNFAFLLPEYSDSLLQWEKYLKEIDTAIATGIAPSLAQLFRFSEDEITEIAHMLKNLNISLHSTSMLNPSH